jgi:hypothetical protein
MMGKVYALEVRDATIRIPMYKLRGAGGDIDAFWGEHFPGVS